MSSQPYTFEPRMKHSLDAVNQSNTYECISGSSGRYLVNGAQPRSASGSSAAAMNNCTMDLHTLHSNSDKKCVLQLDIVLQALIDSSNKLAGRRAQK